MDIQEITLIKVDANHNNNKFYRVTLHEDDSITTSWGRVGNENVQSQTQYGGERRFNTIVRGKERKGYKKTEVQQTTPTKQSVDKKILHDVVSGTLINNVEDSSLTSAIKYMVDCNRHEIIKTSGGMLKVDDDGVVKTPLGIVSSSSIDEASKILDEISSKNSVDTRVRLTSDYLTLIPQKVVGRDWASSFFDDLDKINNQRSLLRQLRSSLDWFNAQDFSENKEETDLSKFKDLFNVTLNVVDNKTVLNDVEEYYVSTLSKNHSSRHLKIKNVYGLSYPDFVDYDFNSLSKELGNEKMLWHGTDAGNVLSILREGLFCPPITDRKFKSNGRMYGNGVYLSDCSSKSLNYSQGYWSGTRNDRCFMFLADFIMGNEYRPNYDKSNNYRFDPQRAYFGIDGKGNKFDSISVKGGAGEVLNNEMIVWNTKQIRLKYLIEFNK